MTPLFTPPFVAKMLGVAPETVHGWIRSGQLKAANVASGVRPRYRIRPADVDAFLESRSVAPVAVVRRRTPPVAGTYRRFSE